MRFLIDECTGSGVAAWLSEAGHDVFSAFDEARGHSDEELLARAQAEMRIIITNDKDFGEMIFRHGQFHYGVILLRLQNERLASKIIVLDQLLSKYADRIPDAFVVVTENHVRIR